MNDFEQKVDKLLQKFEGSRQDFTSQIGEWRNEYRKAMIAINLAENQVIKDFCIKLFNEIDGIDYRLQNERSITLGQEDRDRLLDKKILFQEFLYIFIGNKRKVEAISKTMDENLK